MLAAYDKTLDAGRFFMLCVGEGDGAMPRDGVKRRSEDHRQRQHSG
ncbi:hypothetical protein [Amphiplicatus metriothermophilus]|uniref:Uncharacterized protein n=1 Tax=Amphiplicatus metriothermophilus TaxID=1519374 RepID=A0A239PUJ9_9PROT|nr:hypothetical protein [Amphiplicatus metriothermophilus]MBB5519288.1 hypothetical protein [Amphiplicatus metriothermophilus]SNT73357.1 hypothetical protein SAMN06297382_1756 [Amphiplicatus metriothermophilus]